MSDIVGSIWWMIVALGVLVTFHEFGHYWVARRCGVKVLRFSVGFGKPLWSRFDRHGTEFAIAAIPLGGYVKMLDEAEGDVPASQLKEAFNRKPVLQRIAIVAAGPIANLVLCVALLWAMFVIGRPDYSATLGQVQGIAAKAGFVAGDRIQEIEGQPVRTFGDAIQAMTTAAMDGRDLQVAVVDSHGLKHVRTLPLSTLASGFDQENVSGLAGFAWRHQLAPAVVEATAPGMPASGLLLPGDRIAAIDGAQVRGFGDITPLVQKIGERGGAGKLQVERDGKLLTLEVAPARYRDPASGRQYWSLGIAPPSQPAAYDSMQRLGPLAAIPAAFRETGKMTSDSLGMIRRMFTGHASVKGISGPLTIAQVANNTAKMGVAWFLFFLALLSLSLAIINLLPIPVLDGGHLLYYLIELVKGSPLSERAMATGQYVGLAMLASLMGLAFYNDIFRLVT
ncbi:RIP metalloprotease RseP [Pseudoxanthomonas yeongjuensis]|uniref:RIP metalloprotease RseP n=1 Tax=Pseudoxanthomonas yeongjuensis TaxID=377616 RepID=UPI0013910604|nr:RIP metalloprotease RseP [Pseudoxanthomonas yeongjuensis]KAF1718277.1 RIP metalloprotease RseP [Pseudoxanthomonas yeongjuensis]